MRMGNRLFERVAGLNSLTIKSRCAYNPALADLAESSVLIERLLPPQGPLLSKFYRQHGSPMRAVAGAQWWVAKDQEIVAGLNLVSVEGGCWLTGLFVAPEYRNAGLATQLMGDALAHAEDLAWLFCHPSLQPLYAPLGFSACEALPQALRSRLERYQQNKKLIAMVRQAHSSALGSRSGNSTLV